MNSVVLWFHSVLICTFADSLEAISGGHPFHITATRGAP